jgi:hypothetical protein
MSVKFGALSPSSKWKKEDPCHDPLIYICLNSTRIVDGYTVVTGSLASDGEIDFAIDKLKEDLEKVRKEAKRKRKTLRNKMSRDSENE